MLSQVADGFNSLRGSPPELYKAYLLKFLDSYAYFSLSLIFTLFLSDEFGYTDVEAGALYGACGALITIFGLLTGVLIDNLGVAMSLRVGMGISLAGRVILFLTASRITMILALLFLLPLGGCLGIPVIAMGVRRYTRDANRGFAFGLFYVIMNVAGLIAGPVVDLCNSLIDTAPTVGRWSFTDYRAVLLSGMVTSLVAFLVSLTVREIKVVDDEQMPMSEPAPTRGARTAEESIIPFRPAQAGTWEIMQETYRSPHFWRFLTVIIITLNVRMVFRHLDATFPKYMIREFGDNAPFGSVYAINPTIIIFLVPVISAATTKVDPLIMIHLGTYVSAASVFFIAFSTTIWACVAFVTVLSIGEAIWSPRLYDYCMRVCKEGREGTYIALSSAPLFLAKLPVGFLSGYLLQEYCPENGEKNSELMWLIIGLISITSPILMTVFWTYISKSDEEEPLQDTGIGSQNKAPDQMAGKSTELASVRLKSSDLSETLI